MTVQMYFVFRLFGFRTCRLAPVAWRLSPGTCRLAPPVALAPVAWHLSPGTCSLAPVAWHLSPGTLQSQTPLLPTATVKNSLNMKNEPFTYHVLRNNNSSCQEHVLPDFFFTQHLLG